MDDIPAEAYGITEKTFTVSETRIPNSTYARSLVQDVIAADEQRAKQRELVNANLAGAAPYKASDMKGAPWMASINFMGVKARVDAAMNPYIALLTGVESYAVCCTNYDRDNPEKQKWDAAITRNFHRLLKRWNQFDWHILHAVRQMIIEGWAPVTFDPGDDWRFRAINADCIKVPKGSPSCLDDRVPYVVLLVPYQIHELYEKIADESTAEEAGWNVDAIKSAIRVH